MSVPQESRNRTPNLQKEQTVTTEPTADERYLRTVLDAIPLPVLVVDDDVRILDANREALRLLGDEPEIILRRRGGEVLHCIYAQQALDGCGTSDVCPDCTIRRAVNSAHLGKGVAR